MNGQIELSHVFGCYIWTCIWGCRAIDFESEDEALQDFLLHDCQRSC